MLVIGSNSASTGYNLTRSLRFRRSASAYLSHTNVAPTDGTKWTYSVWRKFGDVGAAYDILLTATANNASMQVVNGVLRWYGSSTTAYDVISTQTWRDPSAWYHFVFVYDSTQATAANRLKYYVNGVQGTFSSATYPSLNLVSPGFNASGVCTIGADTNNARYSDGEMTEVNFIDGQALTPSSFGSTNALTGVWQPAAYTGTYGTNGFYLPFTDNSALTTSSNVGLGKDFSGNGNYWVTNNISITAGVTYDSMTDVPTLTSATASNFAVLNPLSVANALVISDGNLNTTSTANTQQAASSIGMSSGKWYYEHTVVNVGGSFSVGIGASPKANAYVGDAVDQWGYLAANGNVYTNSTNTAYGATYTTGDIIGIAYDANAGKLWFSKNGVFQASGDPAAGTNFAFSGITGTMFALACGRTAGGTSQSALNFGQRPFTYTPPTGYVALNTFNLPTSTIVKGNTVMDATLYTGTLLSNAITNAASFKPDLVWVKSRSAATSHKLTDSVRGVTKGLISNTTGAETTDTQGLTAFGSAGFTVGTNTDYNNLAATYVGWQWQAGQGTTSSNTNGTITSTVSVNASAGFSVVTYTGTGANATAGHGLGVAPSMIITKNRGTTSDWGVYHSSLTSAAYFVLLNSTAAQASGSTYWNSTAPTSNVFSVGTATPTNASANTYVAYCWTPIAGFSAFGSYTGNNSTSGPFVYLGFKPKFVLIKSTSIAVPWVIFDSVRSTYNVVGNILFPNASSVEDTAYPEINFLSNGFSITANDANSYINSAISSYIYMAFAENPFRNSLAR